jgi:2-polyprenyl-3-methyl-5-hydroxy-6-metoxy-1,4-benzoquinol methylase
MATEPAQAIYRRRFATERPHAHMRNHGLRRLLVRGIDKVKAVVLWHVLEHVPDPLATLERARQILRPGGLLVIAVPNFESLQARFSGRHWFHLDVPRHYHHFGLSILKRMLREAGFTISDVSHLSLEYNPYGWIQSILNRTGLRSTRCTTC